MGNELVEMAMIILGLSFPGRQELHLEDGVVMVADYHEVEAAGHSPQRGTGPTGSQQLPMAATGGIMLLIDTPSQL